MTPQGFEQWILLLKNGARFYTRFQEDEWSVRWDESQHRFLLESACYSQNGEPEIEVHSAESLFLRMKYYRDEKIIAQTR